MPKKGPGLSIPTDDLEPDRLETLAANPYVTSGGTFHGSKVVVSATGVTAGGNTMALNPEHLEFEAGASALGKGSSGSVRRCLNKQTGEHMALKEIKLTNEHHLSEIQKELETLYRGEKSQHPCLIDFFGAYTGDGSVYIAMECMDGSLVDQPAIPETILAKMTKLVLSGLVYLHRNRHLVHRDLKPSNLLFNKNGKIKITDFGVSSQLEGTKASAVSFVGTVTYMSPERLQGDNYSYPGDIWSLGITLVELLAGEHPYKSLLGDTSQGTEAKFWALVQHLSDPAKSSIDIPSDSSPEFKDFVQKCVMKDAADRATAEGLLQHPWIAKNCACSDEALQADISAWISTKKAAPSAKAPAPKPSSQGLVDRLDALV